MPSYSDIDSARVSHGIMFHHFHGRGHPAVQGSIDANTFADMIEFLGGRTRILDAQTWLAKAIAGRLDPGDLCLTFDDSLLCQKEIIVPVLRDLGLTGFFFVYSSVFEGRLDRLELYRQFRTRHFDNIDDFYGSFFELVDRSDYGSDYRQAMSGFIPKEYLVEFPFYSGSDRTFRYVRDKVLGPTRYPELMDTMIEARMSIEVLSKSLWMQNDDIQQLAGDGHVVGMHSYSHPTTLVELPQTDQRSEYHLNADHLQRTLGTQPLAVSHPCNSYNGETLNILKDLGVQVGFRANMAMPDGTGFEYPREDHANILAMMTRG